MLHIYCGSYTRHYETYLTKDGGFELPICACDTFTSSALNINSVTVDREII